MVWYGKVRYGTVVYRVEASNLDLHTRQSRALFFSGFQSPWSLLVLLHRVRAYRVSTTRTTVHNAHTWAKIDMNIELKLRVDLP